MAVALPLRETYSYALPDGLAAGSLVGCRVTVPFGWRKATGFVLGEGPPDTDQPLRPLLDISEEDPLFHSSAVPFLEWVASYYLYPIGLLIQSVAPEEGAFPFIGRV